jgi:hypothetical protein
MPPELLFDVLLSRDAVVVEDAAVTPMSKGSGWPRSARRIVGLSVAWAEPSS